MIDTLVVYLNLGRHGGFILISYASMALVLGGLVVRAFVSYRQALSQIAALEARGIHRRSQPSVGEPR